MGHGPFAEFGDSGSVGRGDAEEEPPAVTRHEDQGRAGQAGVGGAVQGVEAERAVVLGDGYADVAQRDVEAGALGLAAQQQGAQGPAGDGAQEAEDPDEGDEFVGAQLAVDGGLEVVA